MSTMSTESPKSSKSASSSNDSDNNDFSDDYSSSDDDSPWQIKENMLRTEFEWTKVVHESEGVPTHMWTFGNPSNTSVHKGKGKSMPKKVEEPSRLMVRQEFHDALVAILKWLGAKKGERNRIPFEATSTLATPSDEYPNPFREFQLKGRERLVIAGLPGIGKTSFIRYVLLLRVALNLPTLYCEGRPVYLWQDHQLYEANCEVKDLTKEDYHNALDPDTRCILDSNGVISDVPPMLYNLNYFILQASSPRQHRIQWVKKAGAKFFFMREWSKPELAAAWQLQLRPYNEVTVEQLHAFHDVLGGSARDAYQHAKDLESLKKSLASLTEHFTLSILVENHSVSSKNSIELSTICDDLAHFFASVYPSTDNDRTEYDIRPVSPYVMDLIWTTIVNKNEGNKFDTFSQLMRSSDIAAKTLGAHYYNHNYHMYLCSGQPLPVYRMTVKKDATSGQQTRMWSSFQSEKEEEPDPPTFFIPANVRSVRFEISYLIELEPNTYYIPQTQNFSTFDSMWVVTKDHVVIIQATISIWHSVSMTGLKWLAALGVKTVEYIFLSPLLTKSVSIPLPVEVPSDLKYPDVVQYPTIVPTLSELSLSLPPVNKKKNQNSIKQGAGKTKGNKMRAGTTTAGSSTAVNASAGSSTVKNLRRNPTRRARANPTQHVASVRSVLEAPSECEPRSLREGASGTGKDCAQVELHNPSEIEEDEGQGQESEKGKDLGESQITLEADRSLGTCPVKFLGVYHVLLDPMYADGISRGSQQPTLKRPYGQ